MRSNHKAGLDWMELRVEAIKRERKKWQDALKSNDDLGYDLRNGFNSDHVFEIVECLSRAAELLREKFDKDEDGHLGRGNNEHRQPDVVWLVSEATGAFRPDPSADPGTAGFPCS